MKIKLITTTLLLAASVITVSAADVNEIWGHTCAKCHGADGKGETKIGKKLEIKDFTDAKYQASLKDEDMFKAIKEGIKVGDITKMKAVEGLSDDEIKALVAYVRGLKAKTP